VSSERKSKPHTWEFTLVLVEMQNRKTASFEHKNRPRQETSATTNMGQPQPSKPSGDSKKSTKTNVRNLSTHVPRNSNGVVVKEVRPTIGPTRSVTEGGRGPLLSLARAAAGRAASTRELRKRTSQSRASTRNGGSLRYKPNLVVVVEEQALEPRSACPHCVPPAPRLVGIETNPGPHGKGKGETAAKMAAHGQRKAKRVKAKARKQPGRSSASGSGAYTLPNTKPGQLAQWGGKSWGRGLGELAGRYTGVPYVDSVLGEVGHALHSGFKYLTGFGSYQTRVASYNKAHVGTPTMDKLGNNTLHMAGLPIQMHTTKLGTRVGDVGFVINLLASTTEQTLIIACNPAWAGSPGSNAIPAFTELPAIASSYQKWCPLGMVFQQITKCKDLLVSVPLPNVIYSVTYNVDKLPLTTVAQQYGQEMSVSAEINENLLIPIEFDKRTELIETYDTRVAVTSVGVRGSSRMLKPLGDPATGENSGLRLCDPCYLQVTIPGTTAVAAGTILAELWQASDTMFYERQLSPYLNPETSPTPPAVSHYYSYGFADAATTVHPLGTLTNFRPDPNNQSVTFGPGGLGPTVAGGLVTCSFVCGNTAPSQSDPPPSLRTGTYVLEVKCASTVTATDASTISGAGLSVTSTFTGASGRNYFWHSSGASTDTLVNGRESFGQTSSGQGAIYSYSLSLSFVMVNTGDTAAYVFDPTGFHSSASVSWDFVVYEILGSTAALPATVTTSPNQAMQLRLERLEALLLSNNRLPAASIDSDFDTDDTLDSSSVPVRPIVVNSQPTTGSRGDNRKSNS
jgi:hypothetical protein